MDIFFNLLKKGLAITFLAVFAFVISYSPLSQIDKSHTVYAQEAVYDAKSDANLIADYAIQGKQLVEQSATNISTSISAAFDVLMEGKEFTLDAAAWEVARMALSQLLRSMIDWVNAGFPDGGPAFVQDIQGYLMDVGDRVFSEYISLLGDEASFICEPFRLDIQIALSLQYQGLRNQPAPTCTITGVIDNIEGFMDGAQGGFSANGGWASWFDIVSQPSVNTPYGARLTAEAGLNSAIRASQDEEMSFLGFGSGFRSLRHCENVVTGKGATKEVCSVKTPGQVISKAISSNLDSERESWVAADEIGELIDALIGAVLNQAVQSTFGPDGLIGS